MSITLKQILDLVGRLDDSPGDDTPRERFRRFLKENVKEVGQVRDYVEECIRTLPYGEQLIREYYEIAPLIVAAIDSMENRREIYMDLYERLVLKSLELIQTGRKNEAVKNYQQIVSELKRRYLNV